MATSDRLSQTYVDAPDVILVGSGIMSATLAVMLKVLKPGLRIQMYEVTDQPAQESSHGWNNAGTGHAGLCELSYTPHQRADGSVDVSNAIKIFEEFEASRQLWSFAVRHGILPAAPDFIRPVPHVSFVSGAPHVSFLRARQQALVAHPFFRSMQFTSDPETVSTWAPLLMDGRSERVVAATRVKEGTDVNFGVLARSFVAWLAAQPGCGVATGHRVTAIRKGATGWNLLVRDQHRRLDRQDKAPFVFIGAGGGSLPLLQQSGIAESRGIGGFPIGGQWLVCDNPEIVDRHHAKVYGQALGAAPTMAVPHLDTRVLDGKRVLLFGPFAAWTSKFLHGGGSHFDLPRSIRSHNLLTLANISIKNLDLIRYLVQQGKQSKEDRMGSLRTFYPAANSHDWRLIDAGIRVQAIKSTEGKSGIVHYGTEVITDTRKSIAALLGASPGASVSASIAIRLIETCLPQLLSSEQGRERMQSMVPTYGVDIKQPQNADFYASASAAASGVLQIESTAS